MRLDASAEGLFGGSVSFDTNDADENPFDFSVSGEVILPPAIQIVDNGDSDFSTVGPWNRWIGQGYENDIEENLAGIGDEFATWTFNSLSPGTYRIAATWTSYSNRARRALNGL